MIEEVIDEIGRLNDLVDTDKWKVAEAVHDAFQEFPHHTQGLLQGLTTRLKVSTTQIYSYRDGWEAQKKYYGDGFSLSVSHMAKALNLSNQFDLTDEDTFEYLETAKEEGWSVAKLAQEISGNHDPNPEEKERKTFEKMIKTMRLVWTYQIFNQVPEHTRTYFYRALKELEDYINGS